MSERTFKSVRGELTPEQSRQVREGQRWASDNRDRLNAEALEHKRELDALIDAMRRLKALREARGLSLADVAQRSGIDRSNLSRLENEPYPNPTLSTLMRIADAIGVRLTLGIVEKDAA